jgi:hypothetical protein
MRIAERFWLGHANRTVGDNYSLLKENTKFCKQIADKIGIRFKLPDVISASAVPNVPKGCIILVRRAKSSEKGSRTIPSTRSPAFRMILASPIPRSVCNHIKN